MCDRLHGTERGVVVQAGHFVQTRHPFAPPTPQRSHPPQTVPSPLFPSRFLPRYSHRLALTCSKLASRAMLLPIRAHRVRALLPIRRYASSRRDTPCAAAPHSSSQLHQSTPSSVRPLVHSRSLSQASIQDPASISLHTRPLPPDPSATLHARPLPSPPDELMLSSALMLRPDGTPHDSE